MLALQKVALVWIFYMLHIITSNKLPYILYLNISIISNLDICPKSDTYAADARAKLRNKKSYFLLFLVSFLILFSIFFLFFCCSAILRCCDLRYSQAPPISSFCGRGNFNQHRLRIASTFALRYMHTFLRQLRAYCENWFSRAQLFQKLQRKFSLPFSTVDSSLRAQLLRNLRLRSSSAEFLR